jgi:putative ABC transport system ATP-binding protein
MVTHDPIAASCADEVVLLRDGQLAGVLPNPRPDTVLAALSSLSRARGPQSGPPDGQPFRAQPPHGQPPHGQVPAGPQGRFAGQSMRAAGA